jgi:hypothetical protein
MINTRHDLMSRTAYGGFLVLFPVFVLYHYSLAAGWVPAFLGGLFGAAALVFALFGLAQLASGFQSNSANTPLIEQLFLLYVVYLFLWTLGAMVAIGSRAYAVPAVTESLGTLAIWLAVYFVGSRLKLPSRTWPMLKLLIVGIALTFVHAIYVHGSFIGPFLMFQGDGGEQDGGTTYQGVGRSIVVTGVLVAGIQPRLFAQLVVLGVATLTLLALGSRAHLFAMGLLVVLQVVLFGFRRQNLKTGMFAMVTGLAAAYAAAGVFLETRAAEIFDLGQSTSWQARVAAQSEAMGVIESEPFLGRFGYHLGDSAGYAHNALSVWAGYGGVAFALFVALSVYALALSGYHVLFRSRCPAAWVVAFQLNITAILLALASEPIYASVFPALGWGFTAAALRQESRNRRVREVVRPAINECMHVRH